MSERAKLEKEIAYYTALLQKHSKHRKPNELPTHSLAATKPTHIMGYYADVPKQHNRTVISSTVITSEKTRRTVVKPRGESVTHSKRVVLNPSTFVPEKQTAPASTDGQYGNSYSSSSIGKPGASNSNTHNQPHSAAISRNKFVWVNKSLLMKPPEPKVEPANLKRKVEPVVKSSAVPNKVPCKDNPFKVNTKYKLVKANNNSATSSRIERPYSDPLQNTLKQPAQRKTVSKFKIRTVPVTTSTPPFTVQTRYKISKSGKRWISKYKMVRRSLKKKQIRYESYASGYAASPVLCAKASWSKKKGSPFKLDRRKQLSPWAVKSKYKLDKIANRKPAHRTANSYYPRKALLRRKGPPMKNHNIYKWQSGFVSPYKLIRTSGLSYTMQKKQQAKLHPQSQSIVRHLASRALARSAAVSLRAKYRKDNTKNKHCLFYMRFGKCNRGDKCFYIHDPERIVVCTRYLRGTCNIQNCPFSHDAKKEKVPVCQHFLRGFCLRDNCPYLHVNVGKDAPICESFAETRYCHLGDKCKKLHTDICPNRDDEGKCPKGNQCRLRHPKKLKQDTNKSPLKDSLPQTTETKPVANSSHSSDDNHSSHEEKIMDDPIVPEGEKLQAPLPSYISLSSSTSQAQGVVSSNPASSLKSRLLKTKPNFLQ